MKLRQNYFWSTIYVCMEIIYVCMDGVFEVEVPFEHGAYLSGEVMKWLAESPFSSEFHSSVACSNEST